MIYSDWKNIQGFWTHYLFCVSWRETDIWNFSLLCVNIIKTVFFENISEYLIWFSYIMGLQEKIILTRSFSYLFYLSW